jgi:septum site-determining protein MinD
MTVYTIASGKGGAGKSSFTLNMGAALSELGLKTLVIDCDIGMANLNLMIKLESETKISLHEVLAGKADVHEAINHTSYGMDVIPSGISISGFKQADPEKLRDVMGQIVDEYDFILIDSPAGISKESVVPLAVCDEAILIVNPELPSITDALKTKLMADIVGRKVKGAVINRVMGTKGELGASKIAELLEVSILGVLPNDRNVMKATAFKVPVVIKEPNSPVAKKIKKIAKKIANVEVLEEGEAREEKKEDGFIERLLKSLGVKT